jgi:hypothetical protein
MGRPSDYSEELADRICDLMMDGKSMRKVAAMETMPDRSTMLRWLVAHPDFAAKCARAREIQADLMDDRVLETAELCDESNCHSSKVKISAYQWRASKLAPKKYGDKQSLEHSGPDGQSLAPPVFNVNFVSPKGEGEDDEE